MFAALFFLFFGLQIDPATLPPVLWQAVALAVVTALTKLLTGWWAVRRAGGDTAGGLRAGGALVARGEFSIVIAGLGVGAGLNPAAGAADGGLRPDPGRGRAGGRPADEGPAAWTLERKLLNPDPQLPARRGKRWRKGAPAAEWKKSGG